MCYCGIHYTQHLPPCWTLKPDVMNEGMHDHVVVPCHAPKHISDDFLGYVFTSKFMHGMLMCKVPTN